MPHTRPDARHRQSRVHQRRASVGLAALSSTDSNVLTVSMTSKSETDALHALIHLNSANTAYDAATVYAVYGDRSRIRLLEGATVMQDGQVQVTLPPYYAAMVVITSTTE